YAASSGTSKVGPFPITGSNGATPASGPRDAAALPARATPAENVTRTALVGRGEPHTGAEGSRGGSAPPSGAAEASGERGAGASDESGGALRSSHPEPSTHTHEKTREIARRTERLRSMPHPGATLTPWIRTPVLAFLLRRALPRFGRVRQVPA